MLKISEFEIVDKESIQSQFENLRNMLLNSQCSLIEVKRCVDVIKSELVSEMGAEVTKAASVGSVLANQFDHVKASYEAVFQMLLLFENCINTYGLTNGVVDIKSIVRASIMLLSAMDKPHPYAIQYAAVIALFENLKINGHDNQELLNLSRTCFNILHAGLTSNKSKFKLLTYFRLTLKKIDAFVTDERDAQFYKNTKTEGLVAWKGFLSVIRLTGRCYKFKDINLRTLRERINALDSHIQDRAEDGQQQCIMF